MLVVRTLIVKVAVTLAMAAGALWDESHAVAASRGTNPRSPR